MATELVACAAVSYGREWSPQVIEAQRLVLCRSKQAEQNNPRMEFEFQQLITHVFIHGFLPSDGQKGNTLSIAYCVYFH